MRTTGNGSEDLSEGDRRAAERRLGRPVARAAEIEWLGDMVIVREDERGVPCELPPAEAISDRRPSQRTKEDFDDYDRRATGAASPALSSEPLASDRAL